MAWFRSPALFAFVGVILGLFGAACIWLIPMESLGLGIMVKIAIVAGMLLFLSGAGASGFSFVH